MSESEQDPLVRHHLALMPAYSFVLRHTIYPRYPLFTAAVSPHYCATPGSYAVRLLEFMLAPIGFLFAVAIPVELLAALRKIELSVIAPVRNHLHLFGLGLIGCAWTIVLTVLSLNACLVCIDEEDLMNLHGNRQSLPRILLGR